jgi:hypothetical protein
MPVHLTCYTCGADYVRCPSRVVGARSSGSSSQYRGVTWNKQKRRWLARVQVGGRSLHVGFFRDEHAAGEAARAARLERMPFATDQRHLSAVPGGCQQICRPRVRNRSRILLPPSSYPNRHAHRD